MFVIVFHGSHDVFGPFESISDIEKQLIERGFSKVIYNYWSSGASRVYIKEAKPLGKKL